MLMLRLIALAINLKNSRKKTTLQVLLLRFCLSGTILFTWPVPPSSIYGTVKTSIIRTSIIFKTLRGEKIQILCLKSGKEPLKQCITSSISEDRALRDKKHSDAFS